MLQKGSYSDSKCVFKYKENLFIECVCILFNILRGVLLKVITTSCRRHFFHKFKIFLISKEFIVPSCVIKMDVAYWRIPVTMIEIYRQITIY